MQREDETPMPSDADAPDNVVPIGVRRRARKRHVGERTELDLAELLVQRFGGSLLRHCAALGGWFVWTGTHWERDHLERARECVKDVARELAREASTLLDEDTFKAAKRAGSASGVDAVLSLARSTPGIVFAPGDADSDPWLLNAENGTIDLRTGEIKPHDRTDLITRACGAPYDPRASAPIFEKFLAEVQPDPDVRAYLARLFGYAAIGLVRDHVLGVFQGVGANGKSVLADGVSCALGDYAKPGPPTLIVSSSGRESHPTDVASCAGARLVVVHETKRGAQFDASKVKLLTGGDRLTAHFMHKDFFVFTPSHTLIMLSNYRPQADATDAALWRRVQLVPFDVVIPPERRDPLLGEKLRVEAAGILAWIVRGAMEWQRMGLNPPAKVIEQTASYRAAEDVIGAFLEERTVRSAHASVAAGKLYQAFKKWCDENGNRAARSNDFAAEIEGRGFAKKKRASGLFYLGIGMHADEYSQDGRGQE